MKKYVVLMSFCLVSTFVFGQKEKEIKLNEETNLVEATYYHDNGEVSQQGTFNLEGKLHGDWVSYNEEGIKISEGAYANGVKTGKWFFWSDGNMKEVEFSNNTIATVINRENTKSVTKN
ncbi:MAG: toxin-antitoxin system YwqK family antitoxin [Flavobacteriaceae bacterium]